MQDKYEYYPRPLIQTSQKVRKSRMSPGAGAGVEPDFKFLLEPEPEWSRVKNLAGSATLKVRVWDEKSLIIQPSSVFRFKQDQKVSEADQQTTKK